MAWFTWPRSRKPTPEQQAALSRISNPLQKKALLDAIEKGEEIPSYAWTPISDETDPSARYNNLQDKLESFRQRLKEYGTTLEALIEFDPQSAARAMNDETLLLEIIAKMKATKPSR